VNSPIRSVDFKNFTYQDYNYPDGSENLVARRVGWERAFLKIVRRQSRFCKVLGLDNQDEAVVTII